MNAIKKIRKWLEQNNYNGVILSRRDNFAWVTGGKRNYVLETCENGVALLIIKPDSVDLIADNIDLKRIQDEELDFEVHSIPYPWYESQEAFLQEYIGVQRMAADIWIEGATEEHNSLVNLRMTLSDEEVQDYKMLGQDCATLVESLCRDVKGLSENEIAIRLKTSCLEKGINTHCVLVGSDDRIMKYRHPMPTDNIASECLMVVLGAERKGLYISLTRMIYYKPVPDIIKKKYEKVQYVFSLMQTMMKEGVSYSEHFDRIKEAYCDVGYEEEWKLHHQGGPTGYACREFIVKPYEKRFIKNMQAYAWNPSITGTKCEDTTLLSDDNVIVLTQTQTWPRSIVTTQYGTCSVPDILVV